MPGSARANWREADCVRCAGAVAAGAGVLLWSRSGSWVTYHPEHAPEAEPGGMTSDVEALRVNEWDGECEVCGGPVAARAGVLVLAPPGHGRGKWRVAHREHVREAAPPPRGGHNGWHRGPLMAFDIATTGNRYGVDRMLGAAVRVTDGPGRWWLIDPGPEEVSVSPRKTHRITVEEARAEGVPAARALDELADVLAGRLSAEEPLVVWYAPFVLTTLEAELRRHGLASLADRTPHGVSPVCDPLVLDRHADPDRRGGRSLEAVTEWYGVPHGSHRAPYDHPGDPRCDAEAALALASVVGACFPGVGRLSGPVLHAKQTRWHRDRQGQIRGGKSGAGVETWPLDQPVEVLPWRDHDAG
ncbi:hypothetical protein ACFYT4_06105 [Streptomyces sp. NPDC004609]|uniref:hypothetical protein n=1 Tax=Streptomyces sp. NPDC004609 TaxID=3364704 RepID=UPI0036C1C7A1